MPDRIRTVPSNADQLTMAIQTLAALEGRTHPAELVAAVAAGASARATIALAELLRDFLAAEDARRAERHEVERQPVGFVDPPPALGWAMRRWANTPVAPVSADSGLNLALVEERFLEVLTAHALANPQTVAADLVAVLRVELVKGANK